MQNLLGFQKQRNICREWQILARCSFLKSSNHDVFQFFALSLEKEQGGRALKDLKALSFDRHAAQLASAYLHDKILQYFGLRLTRVRARKWVARARLFRWQGLNFYRLVSTYAGQQLAAQCSAQLSADGLVTGTRSAQGQLSCLCLTWHHHNNKM